MKSVDVRIVFDRELGELEAERVGKAFAQYIESAMLHNLIPREITVGDGRPPRVQDVRRAPTRAEVGAEAQKRAYQAGYDAGRGLKV